MKTSTDEVKKKVDMVQYIGQFIQLKKAGRNFKANCPFHSEKSPSFIISPERQLWRCFGACHDGGDIIAFLMKWENITFFEALQELAKYAGVKLDNVDFEDKEWKKKEGLIKINTLAAKYFNYILTEHSTGKPGREYLENREITKKLIETFRLGFAPQSWDSLSTFLKKKGFSDEEILKTGLTIKNDKGRYYDRFRGRLMFPITDSRGTIIGFSGRLLSTNSEQAKYVNTPETLLYRKRETLYGISQAKDAIRKENKVIIVEGEFDMISSYKHGFTHTVAIKGSAFTHEQLTLLKRYCTHLILALDADLSGTETSKRITEDAEKLDFRIDVAHFTSGKDPDEVLKTNPVEFKKAVTKPDHIYDFILNTLVEKYGLADVYAKDTISKEFIPYLSHMTNPIIQNHYVKRFTQLIDIDEHTVEELVRKFNKKRTVQKIPQAPKKEQIDRYELLQRFVLSALLQNSEPLKIFKTMKDIILIDDFSIPAYQNIYQGFELYDMNKLFSTDTFIKNLQPEVQSVFDELFLYDLSLISEELLQQDFKRTLYEVKRYALKEKIKKQLTGHRENEDSLLLTQQLMAVEKHLNKL